MAFPLGRIVVTRAAFERFNLLELERCLRRHAAEDWGDVPAEDAAANEAALVTGSRLLSAYELKQGTLWIITEADRSYTVMMTPEEY